MEIALEYLIIGGALAILGLWLEKFEPPIKRQWIALILMVTGGVIAHIYTKNAMYGFLISGVVYYKRELVEELTEIILCVKDISDSKKESE